ncbi:2-amino-4-hydroxy-6-hydroxymethyldihydropteridine diphosphokinase [Paenirhodobacter hankyongi]|uniref:2-amino-4-hydroxy-6-hydroxymethyldihydropteridine pyrophosphokinase n=1 Tax=Paenirhodobacter hankyongi TaxID=2294033 RepID=A0A421BMH7_9RHOB|nr:2-amino-4-hydroxy-6-hydroxymethyldihydropteridine diphosphokinase [Sinirhodobacter hankyongi]RLL64117.1 2-amino-4-hydroxy-6-hydroxymethyldihydropteridine diphosphokinase [Sinirhodobacter hankyongi]
MANDTFLIALGANLPSAVGLPAQTLAAALEKMAEQGLALIAVSRFYRSPAFPAGSGPDYVNACAVLAAEATPGAVLARLHAIEEELGRIRTERWQARKIDLDLIAAGHMVLPDAEAQAAWRALPLERQMRETPAELILPHPRLQDRGFVLIPLAEIAPGWRHPATGRTVTEMAAALPEAEKAALVPLEPAGASD